MPTPRASHSSAPRRSAKQTRKKFSMSTQIACCVLLGKKAPMYYSLAARRVWPSQPGAAEELIMNRVLNPIVGANKFKFGLFNANCDGGFAISKAPERWRCEWDDVVKACVMADEAGIDFILPVAKWRGLSGEADNLGRSFETLTHSAAIGALTKRI